MNPQINFLISWSAILTLLTLSLSLFSFSTVHSLDALSASMLWLTLFSVVLSMLSSSKLQNKAWSVLIMILLLSFVVQSLLMFYILFELSLIPILLMIIYWGSQPERISAGLYFIFYTSFFSIPFLIVIISLSPSMMFFMWSVYSPGGVLIFGLLMPFLVKMPVFGVHFWLPKAHVEASTSGSMILAGLLLKLGSYGIFRMLAFLGVSSLKWTLSIWLFSSVLSSIITCFQSDLKKLVAYSSVTHMTFMMVGLASMSKFSMVSVLLLSLAHGWASMGMFAMAGKLSHSINSRLGSLMGPEVKLHWVVLIFGLLLLSNASLPPFPSFFPELMFVVILSSTLKIVAMFVILSFAVCYYNVYVFMWLGQVKPLEFVNSKTAMSELMKMSVLCMLTAVSVLWLTIF